MAKIESRDGYFVIDSAQTTSGERIDIPRVITFKSQQPSESINFDFPPSITFTWNLDDDGMKFFKSLEAKWLHRLYTGRHGFNALVVIKNKMTGEVVNVMKARKLRRRTRKIAGYDLHNR